MINKIIDYVEKNRMLNAEEKVVLGVSGGADSVCLFFMFLELKKRYHLKLYVVHVNHGLRGVDAKRDARYVEELCNNYGIEYILVSENVKEIGEKEGISIEEAGRNIRYETFYKVLVHYKADKIAIAHNSDDKAETILFNLFRGTGLKGLTGISPVRDTIIRPLLCISREEIENYLEERNITYCTDLTNLETDYTRNKIRLKVLPYIKENINEKVKEHILNTSVMIDETLSYIEKNADDAMIRTVEEKEHHYCIHIDEFTNEDIVIQKLIIRKIMKLLTGKLKDITNEHINMVISLTSKEVGKRINLPYSMIAQKGYKDIKMYVSREDNMGLKTKEKEPLYQEIVIPGNYNIKERDIHLTFQLMNYKKNLIIPQNGYTKWFDYDKINNTVTLRTKKEGDYFQIDQKGSKKKLKNFFIDRKIPREEREHILLLADGSHIMWVIGERISEAYKIDESTKNILIVKLYGGNENGEQY